LKDRRISIAETKYESINNTVENNSSAKQKINADIYIDEQTETIKTKENTKSQSTKSQNTET